VKVCFQGTESEIRALVSAAEEATGAAIWLDDNKCISSVGSSMNTGLRGLRNRLDFLRRQSRTFNVFFGKRGDTEAEAIAGTGVVTKSTATPECIMADCDFNIMIGSGWRGRYRSNIFLGMCVRWGGSPTELAHVVAHELIGHGFEFDTMTLENYAAFTEFQTITSVDNIFNRATDRPDRCSHRKAW
jgi:hypothetical protein